jgi:hypothetical protein
MSKNDSLFNRFSKRLTRKEPQNPDLWKYMEFYYPSTSKATYEILFPWGTYVVTTEDPLTSEVHKDSRPYLGYITFRPIVSVPSKELQPSLFLITPDGTVWEHPFDQKIEKEKQRTEVIKKEHEAGITTTSMTITSISEPVIDHFKTNNDQWNRYGNLEIIKGKTRLTLDNE